MARRQQLRGSDDPSGSAVRQPGGPFPFRQMEEYAGLRSDVPQKSAGGGSGSLRGWDPTGAGSVLPGLPESRCGEVPGGDLGYAAELFDGLRIGIQFWFGDEEFFPRVRYLWDENALQYLRYETMYFAVSLLRRRIGEEMKKK